MDNLLENFYNENFDSKERPFELLSIEQKKEIENSNFYQRYIAQIKLNNAVSEFKESLKEDIKDSRLLNRVLNFIMKIKLT